jgi:hypothetical protein
LSKSFVASLASAFVLTAACSAFAATDPTPAPTAQTPVASAPAAAPAAKDQTQAPQKTAQKKAPSPDDIICKYDDGTGSRLGSVKICLTRAQWKEHNQD